MLPSLAAEEVDIAWMGEFPAVTGFANRIPIAVFMLEQEWRSHIRLVARPETGIRTLDNLKGRTIGVTFGSSGHNHILLALKKANLRANDVTLVNLQPGHMPGAFASKQIEAALTWEPNVGILEKNGAVRIATTESIGTTLLGVWVVRTAYLKNNKDNIQKFLRGWEIAMERYAKDRLGVLVPEAERLGQTPEGMAAVVDRQQSVRPSYQEQLTARYLGGNRDSRLNRHFSNIANFMLDLKRIDAAPSNWDSFTTTEPLKTYTAQQRK
jgi:ABC-type nitrate/sulfonate/bicarbonate transport system substrate-binding protein